MNEEPANPANEIANHAAAAESAAPPAAPEAIPLLIAVAAWLVPGMGHLILERWMRAVGIFAAVAGLALSGYLLRGNIFPYRPGDAFGMLGFLADAGSGVLYMMGRVFEHAGPDVSRAAGDYGTRFIAAAGIVNVLAVFDAHEIASRRRR